MIKMKPVIRIVRWDRDTLDPSFLSFWFTEFFKHEPWNEYLMCPRCKNQDYGPTHTYGIEEVLAKGLRRCPVCGAELVLFWSEERVMSYLLSKPGNYGEVVFYDNEVAGWWRGYPVGPESFYIDVVAVLPRFRKELGVGFFLEEFKKALEKKRQEGFKHFITRTHKRAKNIRALLSRIGFQEKEASEEDKNRTYWVFEPEAAPPAASFYFLFQS